MTRLTCTTLRTGLLATALLGTAGATLAQDPGTSPWSGDLELGYVATSGNTKTQTIQSKADVRREVDLWRYTINFDSLNTSEDGDRSAERYFLSNKLDYKYSDRAYLFGYASYTDDRFSGFDYQAVAAAGWGYRILAQDTMTWDAEIGPGYRKNKVEKGADASDDSEAILRGYTQFKWKLSPTATFSQELQVETGSDNTISKSVTALRANIIGALAMKLAYTVKYTQDVPHGHKHADTETSVTLVYSF